MQEPIPEDRLRLFGAKGVELVAHSRGDEVDLVVDEPVLVPVLVVVLLRATARDAFEALPHGKCPAR